MSDRLLGVFRHERLQFGFGILMLLESRAGTAEDAGKLGQELDELISMMRTASIRTRGGSERKRRGGSPDSTQRQNFRANQPEW